jgi:hypothetical protein
MSLPSVLNVYFKVGSHCTDGQGRSRISNECRAEKSYETIIFDLLQISFKL